MDKIEVDSIQLVICRLCVEETGVYTISADIRRQIKYCFDISVEPLQINGQPFPYQFICKKCTEILNDYTALKEKFIRKQAELQNKVEIAKDPDKEALQNNNTSIESYDSEHVTIGVSKKRKTNCISSSSEESDKDNDESRQAQGEPEQAALWWTTNYKKEYVCRLCHLKWMSKKSMMNHFNSRHYIVKRKYHRIFKNTCEIKLKKCDDKPNITGSDNCVMHSSTNIVQNVNSIYYIRFTPIEGNDDGSFDSTFISSVENSRRSIRSCSRNSNETVILDSKIEEDLSNDDSNESVLSTQAAATPEITDCIYIDDSSDSRPESRTDDAQLDLLKDSVVEPNLAVINQIIYSSRIQYIKKHNQNNSKTINKNTSVNALKHKFLSIGRKIISQKRGINCMPLIKFIEHRNLDICWIPRSMQYVMNESNYIRIMTRIKKNREHNNNESGWSTYIQTTTPEIQTKGFDVMADENTTELFKDSNETSTIASISLIKDASCTDAKKLLNANPVANPKQLPKKIDASDKLVKIKSENIIKKLEVPEANESDLCMPIIMSTTSLAQAIPIESNINNASSTACANSDTALEGPRIKCKPVSQLMSAQSLRMNDGHEAHAHSAGTAVHNNSNLLNTGIPNLAATPQHQSMLLNAVKVTLEPVFKTDYVVLDTVDFPNVKTHSPFQYFRELLRRHGVQLLSAAGVRPHCLVKFKVLYNQAGNPQPVVLCLSLFCDDNEFCLKVKDRRQQDIDVSQVSAHWQWEILKIFQGEVVSKILSNAQKIGSKVFESTKKFLYLLKSIKSSDDK